MSRLTEVIIIVGIIACLILDLMIWYQLGTIPYKPTEKEVIKEKLVTKEVEVPNPCKDFSIRIEEIKQSLTGLQAPKEVEVPNPCKDFSTRIEEIKQSLVDLQASTDNLSVAIKEVQKKVNYFEKKPTIIVDTDGNITQTINQKK